MNYQGIQAFGARQFLQMILLCSLLPFAVPSVNAMEVTDGVNRVSVETSLSAVADGRVRFVATNTGDRSVAILVRDTPFDPVIAAPLFEVGAAVKAWPPRRTATWTGRRAKRVPPGPEDVLMLMPGASASAIVQLAGDYLIARSGSYTVRYVGGLKVASGAGGTTRTRDGQSLLTPDEFAARFVPIDAGGSATLELAATPLGALRIRPPTYRNCSATEQADIVEAASVAEDYARVARSDLESLPSAARALSPRYRLWFGAHEAARYERVTENFQSIESVLVGEDVTFDCGCDEAGVYAYVYPLQPWEIYLCPAFRAATAGGTDSRAGTIVHELSHFQLTAGTDDHAYSQGAAQNLALTSPALAIDNADNHEYFAENTPSTAIEGDDSESGVTPPPDDAPVDPFDFTELAVGNTVGGELAEGASAFYRVSGASSVSLDSIDGDADLFVYSDAGLLSEICRSIELPGNVDGCELPPGVTSWIQIYGHTATGYELSAGAASDDEVGVLAVDIVGPLDPGVPVTGAVEEGGLLGYTVEGASFVEVITTAGDADLYVFNAPEASEDSLVCIANAYPEDAASDACELSPDASYLVVVFGFQASEYLIGSTGVIGRAPVDGDAIVDPVDADPPAQTDPPMETDPPAQTAPPAVADPPEDMDAPAQTDPPAETDPPVQTDPTALTGPEPQTDIQEGAGAGNGGDAAPGGPSDDDPVDGEASDPFLPVEGGVTFGNADSAAPSGGSGGGGGAPGLVLIGLLATLCWSRRRATSCAGFARVCLLFALGCTAGQAMAGETALRTALEPAGDGAVRFTVTNDSALPVSILTRNTPFDEVLAHPLFEIVPGAGDAVAGRAAAWIGPHAKRLPPAADEVIALEPGASASAVVSLMDNYRVLDAGLHTVRYTAGLRFAHDADEVSARSRGGDGAAGFAGFADAKASTFMELDVTPLMTLRLRAPAYRNCSASEQVEIRAAAEVAERLAKEARAGLQGLSDGERASSPRYDRWFGAYDAVRFDTVLEHFDSIERTLGAQETEFDCRCDEADSVFAYVFPNQPYTVHLCPAFWAANIDGTDSRAGTIVHELSHFTIIAGTDDIAYGQRGAQSLAGADPTQAINNADSHEYFAENTPAIPIVGEVEPRPDPGPVDGYVALASGGATSGSVAMDSVVLFFVEGSSRLTLSSSFGDADLYVYSDAARSDLVCRGDSATDDDICELSSSRTYYVEVFGYTGASYTLTAEADGNGPRDDDPFDIFADSGGGASGLGFVAWLALIAGARRRRAVAGQWVPGMREKIR